MRGVILWLSVLLTLFAETSLRQWDASNQDTNGTKNNLVRCPYLGGLGRMQELLWRNGVLIREVSQLRGVFFTIVELLSLLCVQREAAVFLCVYGEWGDVQED